MPYRWPLHFLLYRCPLVQILFYPNILCLSANIIWYFDPKKRSKEVGPIMGGQINTSNGWFLHREIPQFIFSGLSWLLLPLPQPRPLCLPSCLASVQEYPAWDGHPDQVHIFICNQVYFDEHPILCRCRAWAKNIVHSERDYMMGGLRMELLMDWTKCPAIDGAQNCSC